MKFQRKTLTVTRNRENATRAFVSFSCHVLPFPLLCDRPRFSPHTITTKSSLACMFPALSSLYFLTTHFLDPLLFSGSLCFLDIVLTISRKNRIKTITVSPVRRRPFRKNKFGRLDPPFFNLCSNYRKFLRPIDSFLIRMFRTFPLLWANLVCFHMRRYESSFSFISPKANI